jgi:hypothetical protein
MEVIKDDANAIGEADANLAYGGGGYDADR